MSLCVHLRRLLAVLISSLLLHAAAAQADGPLRTKVGIVRHIDLAASTVIVEGTRYQVAPDAEVELRGSYGAFSMLEVGMQIEYTYEVHSETERIIVEIKQIPDNFTIERV